MNSFRVFLIVLFLISSTHAQYTGGNGDGFTVWTSLEDISLPVELLSHQELITNAGIELKWETASEFDNAGFVIKCRINKKAFKSISTFRENSELKGMGNNPFGKTYQFIDTQVTENNNYCYQVVSISLSGEESIIFQTREITYKRQEIPNTYEVFQNYPNPFNPKTKIIFNNNMEGRVKISIYTILGELVTVLADRAFEEGRQEVEFVPAKNQSSQIFICQIESGRMRKQFKMVYEK